MGIETLVGSALTGLVGNAISTVFQFFQQKARNKHEIALKRLDIDAMIQEAKMNIQITEAKVAGDIQLAEMASFNESVKQNAIQALSAGTLDKLFSRGWTAPFGVLIAMLFGFIDFLKGLIRPGVTLYMTVAVTMMYLKAYEILKANEMLYDIGTSQALFAQITDAVVYVFVTCVLWWFGDRRVAKVMNRMNHWKQ